MIEKLLDEPYWNELNTCLAENSLAFSMFFSPGIWKFHSVDQNSSRFVNYYIHLALSELSIESEKPPSPELSQILESTLESIKKTILKLMSEGLIFEEGKYLGPVSYFLPDSIKPSEEEISQYLGPINDIQELLHILIDQIIIETDVWESK